MLRLIIQWLVSRGSTGWSFLYCATTSQSTDFPYDISEYQSGLIFLHNLTLPDQPVMFVACCVLIGGSECIYLIVLSLPEPCTTTAGDGTAKSDPEER